MILRTLRLVVSRELRSARKPFVITTLIILTLVGIGLTVMDVTQQNQSDDRTITHGIGLVGATPNQLRNEIRERLPDGLAIRTMRYSTVDQAEDGLSRGSVSVVVVGDDTVLWGPWVPSPLADSLVQALRTIEAEERAVSLGLVVADAEWLFESSLEFRSIEAAEASTEAEEAASAIAVIVMFAAIITYGQWIGYSVAEEKGSRVVELILGAVPPHHLLTGKLLALGSMGLVQMSLLGSLIVGYGIVADIVNIPDLALGLVLWMLVWFLLGYGLYGAIYAAGGSLAADTHEASTTLSVVNLLPIIGYIFGVIAFSQGGDTFLLRLSSFIPLWAPMTMPGRIARGWATAWEVALAVGLMLMAIYAVIRLAGWVYKGGVARASSKLGWREAFRAGRDLRPTQGS
ncbi:MAG: ABC transporter permease [Actinomycetota bacterium]|nr:ABC transporter permease [Actinomycetota bacterium]